MLLLGMSIAACGDDDGGVATSPLPTHDNRGMDEVFTSGMLAGTTECLWLEPTEASDLEAKTSIVFPRGYSAIADGSTVILKDETGAEIARTGDLVAVGGGTTPIEGCGGLDANPLIPGTGGVGRCDEPAFEDFCPLDE